MHLGSLFLDSCICCSDVAILGTFLAVYLQLETQKSAAGMSLQTLIAVVSCRELHLLSHPLGIHYRPIVIPMILYILFDIVNGIAGFACVAKFMSHKATYEMDKDNFGIQIFDSLQITPKSGVFP